MEVPPPAADVAREGFSEGSSDVAADWKVRTILGSFLRASFVKAILSLVYTIPLRRLNIALKSFAIVCEKYVSVVPESTIQLFTPMVGEEGGELGLLGGLGRSTLGIDSSRSESRDWREMSTRCTPNQPIE